MRHIDVMLKRTDPRQQVLAGLARDERKKAISQMVAHANALRELVKTDGWRIFAEELADDKLGILAGLEQATTDTQQSRLVGALLQVEASLVWPEATADELLRSAKEAAENDQDSNE